MLKQLHKDNIIDGKIQLNIILTANKFKNK